MVQSGCVERYCKDGDPEAFSRLVTQYRPMVTGICKKYLVDAADLEEAVQETFVKLARQAEGVSDHVGPWLAVVAGTTALDYARRTLRDRSRRRAVVEHMSQPRRVASWKAMETRIHEALDGLDPQMRSLVMARFFAGEAIKELAERSGIDSSTMSRKVSKALRRLKRGLQDLGYGSLDETLLAGDESAVHDAASSSGPAPHFALRPSPIDRIRVGVILSHQSSTVLVADGDGSFRTDEAYQIMSSRHFLDPRYQLIGLVEPGTEELPNIELGLRDNKVHGGMFDATDPNVLKLLDIIVLPHCYAVTTLLDAVAKAVESGVGLYHEGHAGIRYPGLQHPSATRLLCTEKIAFYHTPGKHYLPRPATIVEPHAIIAGVAAGAQATISGCGPVLIPNANAKVLMYRDEGAVLRNHPHQELNGMRSAALMAGQLGRGRVVMVNMRWTEPMQNLPGLRGNFVHNILDWLAEDRVAQRRIWNDAGTIAAAR